MLSEKNVEENEPQPSSLMLEHETTKQKLTTDSKTNKKVKRSDSLVEVLNKRSQERNKLMEELTKIEDDDPIDVFFKGLALTVKQFSPELKVKAKLDILRIVSELELKNNH
ncbi:Transcription factor Adf-1 [Aphis craccivora]|uniref:Transcription factor Adf-1 n=1 Tax=Aphis craccivora TaxID=307492 RepID=A0A6G0VTD2_APHCR|nr:Transcription factor Adf-1 [Aphis craccivora]